MSGYNGLVGLYGQLAGNAQQNANTSLQGIISRAGEPQRNYAQIHLALGQYAAQAMQRKAEIDNQNLMHAADQFGGAFQSGLNRNFQAGENAANRQSEQGMNLDRIQGQKDLANTAELAQQTRDLQTQGFQSDMARQGYAHQDALRSDDQMFTAGESEKSRQLQSRGLDITETANRVRAAHDAHLEARQATNDLLTHLLGVGQLGMQGAHLNLDTKRYELQKKAQQDSNDNSDETRKLRSDEIELRRQEVAGKLLQNRLATGTATPAEIEMDKADRESGDPARLARKGYTNAEELAILGSPEAQFAKRLMKPYIDNFNAAEQKGDATGMQAAKDRAISGAASEYHSAEKTAVRLAIERELSAIGVSPAELQAGAQKMITDAMQAANANRNAPVGSFFIDEYAPFSGTPEFVKTLGGAPLPDGNIGSPYYPPSVPPVGSPERAKFMLEMQRQKMAQQGR